MLKDFQISKIHEDSTIVQICFLKTLGEATCFVLMSGSFQHPGNSEKYLFVVFL